MKREFLQNLKVGDTALPKEVIDAIMEKDGKDIEAAKKPYADYDTIKEKLQLAEEGLKTFDGIDVESQKGEITKLQEQLTAKDDEWRGKLDDMTFKSINLPNEETNHMNLLHNSIVIHINAYK